MRNVKVMKRPVGVLLAWILVLGYVLWAVEAVGSRAVTKKPGCATPMVEISAQVPSNKC
jgi:hypothetical protein